MAERQITGYGQILAFDALHIMLFYRIYRTAFICRFFKLGRRISG